METPAHGLRTIVLAGIVSSLVGLALFVICALQYHSGGPATEVDLRWAREFQAHAADHPVLLSSMRLVTHVGGVPAMTALAILGGIVLFLRGQHALALGWLIAAAGGGLMNYSVKNWIGRPRPGEELRDSAVTERNESYPSGHSMGSTVGLGSLAYVLGVHLRRRSVRALVVVTLALLIAVIGFSRMYLRAHWFSDVLGGFGLGAFWLALCLTCLELWRRRR